MRRTIILLAALFTLTGGSADDAPAAAKVNWCGLYCDVIYIGCKKTIGLLDPDSCLEWHTGCLDGCRANQ
ncbi:MAG: hypothetical protein ACE5JR_11160 [Gemmatimonadota bacterium]